MESIESVIEKITNDELKRASNCKTKAAVKLRVLLRIGRIIGVSLQSIYDTKDQIRVDPSVSQAIEDLWNGRPIYSCFYHREESDDDTGKDASVEDSVMMQRVLATDFVNPDDLPRIVSALKKRRVRDVWCIFAADGLLGDFDNRPNLYSDNLSIPMSFGEKHDDPNEETPAEAHARAVRTIYKDVSYATPKRLESILKQLFKFKTITLGKRKRRNSSDSSEASAFSSSDTNSSDEDSEDKFLSDRYKRLTGRKFLPVKMWLKEKLCCVQENEKEKNKFKRPIPKCKITRYIEMEFKNESGGIKETQGSFDSSGSTITSDAEFSVETEMKKDQFNRKRKGEIEEEQPKKRQNVEKQKTDAGTSKKAASLEKVPEDLKEKIHEDAEIVKSPINDIEMKTEKVSTSSKTKKNREDDTPTRVNSKNQTKRKRKERIEEKQPKKRRNIEKKKATPEKEETEEGTSMKCEIPISMETEDKTKISTTTLAAESKEDIGILQGFDSEEKKNFFGCFR